MKKTLFLPLLGLLALHLFAWPAPAATPGTGSAESSATSSTPGHPALRGCRGTYDNAPRLPSGRVDLSRLLDELTELRANTYNFLIWHQPTDWEDLQAFLPQARARNIFVWVTLIPPSEAPPRTKAYSEPFRLDILRWADEIGRLSAREPNLVAWSIDDFAHNLKVYTPDQVRAMRDAARRHNPRLAFIPCVYYKQVTPVFAARYGAILDGILFPYRAESAEKANLSDATRVAGEVEKIRSLIGRPGFPVIIDIYATRHSRLNDSTPAYVHDVIAAGRASADGVLIYCHQDKKRSAEKFNVIKEQFNAWAK